MRPARFEELRFYQAAMLLLKAAYKLAEQLPKYEEYNLASQLRRAALSIVLNIAEGYGRYHFLDKVRFFYYARGSLYETLSGFIAAHAIGYVDDEQLAWARQKTDEIGASLNAYINYIRDQKQGAQTFGEKHIQESAPTYEITSERDLPQFPNPQPPDARRRMNEKSRVAVVAIGGNSLIKDKDHQTVPDQYQAAKETCYHIADMIEQGWDVAIGHGNGPQVGFILRRSEIAAKVAGMHEVPLESCGADTQGAIGYHLQQNLQNEFKRRGMDKAAATVVTQVVVDKNDPAFQNPSKPIGTFMEEAEAQERAEKEGWTVVEDAGRGWRRVVPSPLPQEIAELAAVRELLGAGIVTITVGGGGIPVVRNDDGDLEGVAAVIDKDYASALLARSIGADLFLISTAVEKVYLNFNKPDQKALDVMTIAEAKKFMKEGHFAKGSMLPKVQAIIWFLESGGQEAIITNPENIARALRGETGTRIVP